MKPHLEAHSEYDTEWLETYRAPAKVPAAKAAQAVANEEWEAEGGSIKSEKKQPGKKPAPGTKIPL